MNNTILIASLLILSNFISLFSQEYYWYKDEKIQLSIDSTIINVTTTLEANLSSILNGIPISEIKQIEKTINNQLLFSVKLISSHY